MARHRNNRRGSQVAEQRAAAAPIMSGIFSAVFFNYIILNWLHDGRSQLLWWLLLRFWPAVVLADDCLDAGDASIGGMAAADLGPAVVVPPREERVATETMGGRDLGLDETGSDGGGLLVASGPVPSQVPVALSKWLMA
ncbi:hypothetical protein B0T24DRAFT_33084 [Lasiosphaeria ovina]|uniref:Uncharacterized protein n=1 Tax=Lasiosphaeria ovina TaxID=92902 RepID=A0AAE0TXF7_9PEZI|nr:hypothetical protein B0T24DRAFT_33084 [Lasiosphaeria ovina]